MDWIPWHQKVTMTFWSTCHTLPIPAQIWSQWGVEEDYPRHKFKFGDFCGRHRCSRQGNLSRIITFPSKLDLKVERLISDYRFLPFTLHWFQPKLALYQQPNLWPVLLRSDHRERIKVDKMTVLVLETRTYIL